MIKNIKFLALCLMCFVITKSTLNAQESYNYPDEKWEYDEDNSPCNSLNLINRFVIDSLNTTGLLIIKNGKVSLEYGDTNEISYLASARKSILSMMYGKYVYNGTINLNTTLGELGINDVNPLTEKEKQATIDQIINARSGVYLPAANAGSAGNMPQRGQYNPGEHFYYNNWDFNVAGTIFEQKTGKNIYEAFQEDFAIPLGFQDFELSNQKKYGNDKLSIHPAYHFYLSTRDMARLGYLMLKKGKWKDKQIIPENWIKKTTNKVSNTDGYGLLKGYSYMWWLYENPEYPILEGAYSAAGAYGQFITIIPKLEMVIAHKTKRVYDRITSPPDYDKFIVKLIEGEIQARESKKNIDLTQYIGTYTDDNFDESSTLEVFIENEQLILKDSFTWTEGVKLNLCNELIAVITSTPIGNLQIDFTKGENGNINGFYIQNLFIKKN